MHKCHVLGHQPLQGTGRSWQSICPTHLASTQPRSVAHAAHALLQRRSRVGIADRCQPSRLHNTACHARKSKELEVSAELSESTIDDGIGPAFRATLDMLEWSRICDHLSAFSSTQCGKRACLSLGIPRTQRESERLLEETRCATGSMQPGCGLLLPCLPPMMQTMKASGLTQHWSPTLPLQVLGYHCTHSCAGSLAMVRRCLELPRAATPAAPPYMQSPSC